MRLLLNNNLSPKLVEPLVAAGHDVALVGDHGIASADDPSVLALAVETRRVLVSADSDFGALLARTNAISPSFVLVRRLTGRRVPELASVIIENLPLVEDDLEAGAVLVLGAAKLRIRRLPILYPWDGDVRRLVASRVERPEQARRRVADRVEAEPGGADGQVGVLGLSQGVHREHVFVPGPLEDVAELTGYLG